MFRKINYNVFFLLNLLVCIKSNENVWNDNPSSDLSWGNDIEMLENESINVTFTLSFPLKEILQVFLNTSHQHSLKDVPPVDYPHELVFEANTTQAHLEVKSQAVGQMVIAVSVSMTNVRLPANNRLRIYVIESRVLQTINTVIGWIYFAAWTLAWYPQFILNFRRKSVIGLNFDFLAYNMIGFIAYSLYNIGLFWIPLIQQQYFDEYPDGVIPVKANDVFFVLHSTLLNFLIIVQCFIYERGNQRVSSIAKVLLVLTLTAMLILLFVAVGQKITWLEYLMVFSYVKLGVTLVKYTPQVYMNYRRKSTVGYSIEGVLLDVIGGTLSVLQMILQSYNNYEWKLVLGDPTKFGLGLFSVFFDIIFIIQRYVLYRHPRKSDPLLDPSHSVDEEE